VSAMGQFWEKMTPVQRKRILIAVAALVLLVLAAGAMGRQDEGQGPSGAGWQSPASVFAARSPGRRDDRLVTWVKKQRAAGGRRVPKPETRHERVLPATRTRTVDRVQFLPEEPLRLLGEPTDFAFAPSGYMLGFAPAVPTFTAPGFEGLFDLPPSPGGLGTDATPLPPPGPAVPELAVWLQMIVAMGALGVVLRRTGRGGEWPRAEAPRAEHGPHVLWAIAATSIFAVPSAVAMTPGAPEGHLAPSSATARNGGRIVYPPSRTPRLTLPDGSRRSVRSLLLAPQSLQHGGYIWNDASVPPGSVWVRVDLARQLLSVFRSGHEIGTAVILYGAASKPTPSGVYPILERAERHRSNLYRADMPYMLRLTHDGVAIHASVVRPTGATHGCIGVPFAFARRLFKEVRRGDVVAIVGARGET
jgi:L,D-transpeptidase catalytic domain